MPLPPPPGPGGGTVDSVTSTDATLLSVTSPTGPHVSLTPHSSGGGAALTVNSGPLHSSGLLPLAITSQPLVPPNGIIQPLPPLFGFQFPGESKVITVPTRTTTRVLSWVVARNGTVYGFPYSGTTPKAIRLSPTGAKVASYTFPEIGCYWAAIGPDDNLWTVGVSGALHRMTPTGTVSTFTVGLTASGNGSIVVGPDRRLYCLTGTRQIAVVTPFVPATHIVITASATAFGACAGPDGKTWIALSNGSIYTIAAGGSTLDLFCSGLTINEYCGMCVDCDGNVWITQGTGGTRPYKVWRVTPAATVTPFTIPTTPTHNGPYHIVAGAGGDLWFTTGTDKGIWKLTVEGAFKHFPLTAATYSFYSIIVGPDGSFWCNSETQIIVTPFLLQIGGLVLTALSTTDPTNPGEVWADNGTLVQSGHTAGGGAWGAASTARFTFAGDPNGQITSVSEGDLCVDTTTPALYQALAANTTRWQLVGGGGGGGVPQASVTAANVPTFPVTITTSYPTTTGISITTTTGSPRSPSPPSNFKIAPGTYTDWSTLLPAVQAALSTTVPLSHYLTATVTGTKLVLTWKAVTGSTSYPTWSGVGTKGNGYILTGNYQTKKLGFKTTDPLSARMFVNVGTAYSKRQIYTALPTTDPSNPGETFSSAGVLLQSPFTKQAVTGSRLSGAALTSLLAGLVALGLITNTTTT